MATKKLKNEDNCKVLIFILENNLSTPYPDIDPEDLDKLIFMKKVAINYKDGTLYIPTDNYLLDFIEQYRQMFNQKNINYPGKMDSLKSHVDKFKRFIKVHGFSYDEILYATRKYIEEYITKPKYIMKSSNFILKFEQGLWKSELLNKIEEYKQKNENHNFLS